MKGIVWTFAALFCAVAYILLIIAVFNIKFL